MRGSAIEARVYAEDPSNNFAPSPGKLTVYREPSGPWIRVDSGYYEGAEVPFYYDPLIMKVTSWGITREEARRRLALAIEETMIEGVSTNMVLLHAVLNNRAFVSGNYSTRILEEEKILENLQRHSMQRLRLPKKEKAEKVVSVRRAEGEIWRLASRIRPHL